jgi:hypothetical protein
MHDLMKRFHKFYSRKKGSVICVSGEKPLEPKSLDSLRNSIKRLAEEHFDFGESFMKRKKETEIVVNTDPKVPLFVEFAASWNYNDGNVVFIAIVYCVETYAVILKHQEELLADAV